MESTVPTAPARVLRASNLERAGFLHGFSLAPLDFGVRPTEAARKASSRALAEAIGFDVSALYQANQVHGATVVQVGRGASAEARPDADALFTHAPADQGPLAVGVRVADCVPILVGDRRLGGVVAIHAGWRGVVAGVVGAAMARFAEEGSGDYVAAIGPCIEATCFEVSAEVASQIEACVKVPVVRARRGDKAYVDLRAAVRAQLGAAGVYDVEDVGGCTMCGGASYHSFRRDGDASGRQLAVIVSRSTV